MEIEGAESGTFRHDRALLMPLRLERLDEQRSPAQDLVVAARARGLEQPGHLGLVAQTFVEIAVPAALMEGVLDLVGGQQRLARVMCETTAGTAS